MFASTWLARTKGAARCTAWQLGLLYKYLSRGDQTQQRLARACETVTADTDPLVSVLQREGGNARAHSPRLPVLGA